MKQFILDNTIVFSYICILLILALSIFIYDCFKNYQLKKLALFIRLSGQIEECTQPECLQEIAYIVSCYEVTLSEEQNNILKSRILEKAQKMNYKINLFN